jgi:hypothetical protein
VRIKKGFGYECIEMKRKSKFVYEGEGNQVQEKIIQNP